MVPPSLLFPRYTLAFILACARHWYLVLGLLVSACSQKGLHSCGVALERGKYERWATPWLYINIETHNTSKRKTIRVQERTERTKEKMKKHQEITRGKIGGRHFCLYMWRIVKELMQAGGKGTKAHGNENKQVPEIKAFPTLNKWRNSTFTQKRDHFDSQIHFPQSHSTRTFPQSSRAHLSSLIHNPLIWNASQRKETIDTIVAFETPRDNPFAAERKKQIRKQVCPRRPRSWKISQCCEVAMMTPSQTLSPLQSFQHRMWEWSSFALDFSVTLSLVFMSAPASNKSCTVAVWPSLEAQMSAVRPFYSCTKRERKVIRNRREREHQPTQREMGTSNARMKY